LFVGLSMNLPRILADPTLPPRALIGLILLTIQLVVSSVALIPDQSAAAVGVEMVAVAGIAWIATTALALAILRRAVPAGRRLATMNPALLQITLLLYLAGGATRLAGAAGALHAVALAVSLAALVLAALRRPGRRRRRRAELDDLVELAAVKPAGSVL
jgi:hypothetical protein